jgi:hypothetical protein
VRKSQAPLHTSKCPHSAHLLQCRTCIGLQQEHTHTHTHSSARHGRTLWKQLASTHSWYWQQVASTNGGTGCKWQTATQTAHRKRTPTRTATCRQAAIKERKISAYMQVLSDRDRLRNSLYAPAWHLVGELLSASSGAQAAPTHCLLPTRAASTPHLAKVGLTAEACPAHRNPHPCPVMVLACPERKVDVQWRALHKVRVVQAGDSAVAGNKGHTLADEPARQKTAPAAIPCTTRGAAQA